MFGGKMFSRLAKQINARKMNKSIGSSSPIINAVQRVQQTQAQPQPVQQLTPEPQPQVPQAQIEQPIQTPAAPIQAPQINPQARQIARGLGTSGRLAKFRNLRNILRR